MVTRSVSDCAAPRSGEAVRNAPRGLAAKAIPLVRRLAAPQLSAACFVLAAAGALWVAEGDASPTFAMVPSLSLLVVNLLAGLLTNARLRTDLPLLIFHLALAAFVALILAARLTYADGIVSVTRGAVFDGALTQVEQGPLHGDGLQAIRFSNDGFVDEYPLNGNEYRTYNAVRWWDESGQSHSAEIGDDHPLIINGYRIYATRRGLAPRLLWQRTSGEFEFASIQLGHLQADGWYEGNSWQLEDGPKIWVGMQHDIERPSPGSRRVDLGVAAIDGPLVVRVDAARHELRKGESLTLPGGTLTYSQLDAWLGYRIVYDPTTHWIMATALLAIGSLIWFYIRRVFSRPRTESLQ